MMFLFHRTISSLFRMIENAFSPEVGTVLNPDPTTGDHEIHISYLVWQVLLTNWSRDPVARAPISLQSSRAANIINETAPT